MPKFDDKPDMGLKIPVDEHEGVLDYIGDMAKSLSQLAQSLGHKTLSDQLRQAADKARSLR